MIGYKIVNLKIMIDEIGERQAREALSDFSCPTNKDVEFFLLEKSIDFAKQHISQTHLVMAPFEDRMVIAGYFALAHKNIQVSELNVSKTLFKRIRKFGKYEQNLLSCIISAPLIGQIGKNYTYKKYNLITGDELLKLACDKLSIVQEIIGGKIIYLECENKQVLKDFYESNGFCLFGERPLYTYESNSNNANGNYLQYIKYM